MPRIFTHSGIFHGDDAFACAIVRRTDPGKYGIIRGRELPPDFGSEETDIAIDVGGVHDPSRLMFDHHQPKGSDDQMAACGKVWKHFSPQLCSSSEVADRVYTTVLGSIDRADIALLDWSPIRDDWVHLSASRLISSMNPPFGSRPEVVEAAFEAAVEAAEFAIVGAIANSEEFFRMKSIVETAERPIPEVLILTKGGPWQEHILTDEKFSEVLYMIFPSDRGGFQVQCVPDSLGGFGQRCPLPAGWSALRGQELSDYFRGTPPLKVGSELFCHFGLFICGAVTLQDAIRMATVAVGGNYLQSA